LICWTGRLGNPLGDRPPRLETDIGYYDFGIDALAIPPLVGKVRLRDNGIDFLISDTTSIRIAWRGSKEIGDGPDTGKLSRLRILGVAREDETARDGVSLDLRRFLTEAKRAKAEVRSASPIDFSFKTKGGEGRRIWNLRVRVLPEDAAAFVASAEVAWPLSKAVEERLERGKSLTGVPDETQIIDVAFDRGNRDQVMALAAKADSGPPTFRFKGMIVGRSPDSAGEAAPS
jgi:hypothetical protein